MKTLKKALTCNEVYELLFEFVEGTLDVKSAAAVSRHLNTCESCSSELQRTQSILRMLSDASQSPPKKLHDNVMSAIADTPQEPKLIKSRRRYIPYSAIGAVCAAFVVMIAGRHVILGGNGISVADDMNKTSGFAVTADENILYDDVERYSLTNEEYEKSVQEAANQAETEEIYYFTTASVTVSSPNLFDSANAPMPSEPLYTGKYGSSLNDQGVRSVIDGVYTFLNVRNNAILVCMESDFNSILPEFVGNIKVNGIHVELYREVTKAKEAYVGYLEALSGSGAYHRAALPLNGDFSSCELYLIDDAEN